MKILVAAFGKYAASEFASLLKAPRKTRNWNQDQEEIFSFLAHGEGHGIIKAVAGSGKSSTLREGLLRMGHPCEVKTLHALGYSLCPKGGKASETDTQNRVRAALCGLAHKWEGSEVAFGPEGPLWNMIKVAAFAAAWVKNTSPLFAQDQEGMEVFRQACWRGVGQMQVSLPECDEEGLINWLAGCAMAACATVLQSSKSGGSYSMSFDDMLWLPVRIGRIPQHAKYDMVLVDECQDMCPTQILLARMVMAEGGRLLVVGDERQALFGFRGADSQSISRIEAEFPQAASLRLGESFRCPQAVGRLAKVFNPEFSVCGKNAEGVVEQNFPQEEMRRLVSAGDFILCRVNAPLAKECLELLKQGIPAFIRGKDLLKDLVALVKELAKAEGCDLPTLIGRIDEWEAAQTACVQGKKWNPDSKEKAIDLIQDKAATLQAVAEVAASAEDMLRKLNSLFLEKQNAVVLGTIHGAKGLEADNVFVLPEKWYKEGEEEDNIRYVACTRAKKRLYLVEFSIPLPGEEGSAQGEDPQAPTPPAHWAEGDRVEDLIGTGA